MSFINSILNILRFNKKNWRAVVLCCLAATVFWFFNSLNKTYTTNLSFPLEFDYDPRHYIPVEPLADELRINVTGTGWDLFRRSVGFRVRPLVIPLERPAGVKKIVGSTLPALFSGQLESLQINLVVNDTIYVDLHPKSRRWLKVGVENPEQLIRKDYGIVGDVKIDPDSIFIEGPINLINELKEPFPLNLGTRDIDRNFNERIEVKLPQAHLILRDPPEVQVTFQVDRIIEVTDTIALEVINFPRNAQPQIDVQKLKVVFLIYQNRVNSFSRDSVKAVVDLKDFRKGTINVLPNVVGLPSDVKLEHIDSIQIVY